MQVIRTIEEKETKKQRLKEKNLIFFAKPVAKRKKCDTIIAEWYACIGISFEFSQEVQNQWHIRFPMIA